MKFQLVSTAIVCGSVALFSVIWLNGRTRDLVRADGRSSGRSSRQPDRGGAAMPANRKGRENTVADTAATEATPGSPSPIKRADHENHWYEVDLFSSSLAKAGSRFDDTIALPIDTPRRLEAIADAAALRLRALPEPQDLGHRTMAYRARLQQVAYETAQAQERLAAGTYGTCTDCAAPISLALLTQRPWTPLCVYCALDI